MKTMLPQDTKDNVLKILEQERLFRYDCTDASESEVSLLEKDFSELTGFKYSVAMNSCSSAIFISLLTAGIKPGDKVLLPAFTFIAVPSSIAHAFAEPVMVDITEDLVIDLVDLEEQMKTSGAKFLLLSHMRGRISDMDAVAKLCKTYDITFVEDCAHALGVLYRGKQVGYHGESASFSMQSYKMLDGGEGGIFCTNNKEMAIKAMLYTGCYEDNWKKHFLEKGDEVLFESLVNNLPAYNFRMSNLTASVIRPQLKYVEDRVTIFNKNYQQFKSILEKSSNIKFPKFVDNVREAADSAQFFIKITDEDKLTHIIQDLKEIEIKLSIFGVSKNNARCFWRWGFVKDKREDLNAVRILKSTADIRLRMHFTESYITELAEQIVKTVDKY